VQQQSNIAGSAWSPLEGCRLPSASDREYACRLLGLLYDFQERYANFIGCYAHGRFTGGCYQDCVGT
jgi:hypothetical protein